MIEIDGGRQGRVLIIKEGDEKYSAKYYRGMCPNYIFIPEESADKFGHVLEFFRNAKLAGIEDTDALDRIMPIFTYKRKGWAN